MSFEIIMAVLALAGISMCILRKMPPSEALAYQISVLQRLRRALCGLLGLAFIGTGACLFLSHFGFIEAEIGAKAAILAAVLLGVLMIDLILFQGRQRH